MKKHNTFKIVLGTALVFAILSWIIPAAYYSGEFVDQGRVQAGLFDVFNYSLTSLSYFGYLALYVIFVGGFYGVLNKIPAYRNLLDAIVKKSHGKENVVISVIMVLLAAVISIWGIEVEMLLFAPFIISLVLLMGFDKIVAALVVAGSSLVGITGYTYAYGKIGVLLQSLSLDVTSDIYVKLMVLLVGLVLLIFNTLLYINKAKKATISEVKATPVVESETKEVAVKKVVKKTTKTAAKDTAKTSAKKTTKTTKKTTKTSKSTKGNNKAALKDGDVIVVKSDVEDVKGFVPATSEKTQRVWPLITSFILLLVLVLLAFFPWSSVFEITWFEEASQSFSEFELFGFALFGKLFGSFNAFGSWMCTDLFLPLIFFILLLALIYKVSLNEVFEGFAEGAKKALGPAGMIIVIFTILVLTTYHPFQLTIYKAVVGITKGFNVITATIVGLLAGLFNGDCAYAYQSLLPYYTSVVTNTEIYSTVGVLFQSVYGLSMFVAPTSLVLMVVLTYLDIPFTKWLKAIWKFLLEYLAIIVIVVLILVLL